MALDPYLSALIGIIVITLFIYFWEKRKNLPPGPWGLPFFGYFPLISPVPHLDFEKLSKHYGDVFSLRTIGGNIIILSGLKTIKEVLVTRGDEFAGRPVQSNLIEWLSDGLGVAQEEGTPWLEQRRFWLHSIKDFGVGKLELEGPIQDEIKLLLEELRKIGSKQMSINPYIIHTTNCVISRILFRIRLEKDDPDFQKICQGLQDILNIFTHRNVFSVGWFFKYVIMNYFPGSKRTNAGKKHIIKVVSDIVDDHIKTFDPNHQRDFVDSYLHQRNALQKCGKLQSSSFTIERLKAIVMNMYVEGTESIAAGIYCLLYELSKHPRVQEKMSQEIDAIVGKERLPSWMDKPKLAYVDSAITELFRVATPFQYSTLYSNFEETSINGYRIPKRSILVANLWTMNNDSKIYQNPSKFDPGRFLDSDGKKIKRIGPFQFGIGKRSCVGEALAQMEVFLIISSLVQSFVLYPGDEENTVKLVSRE